MNSAMIKYIVFDLGNVVLFFDNHLIAQRLAAVCGRSQAELHAYISSAEVSRELDSGRISPEKFFDSLKQAFGLPLSLEGFTPLWNDIFTPNSALETAVYALKESGYRLGLLSNTNQLHFDYLLERYPVMRAFDDYFLSYRMGLLKPDPCIYREMLDRCRCAPKELVYTDDIERYVQAALALKIRALHFVSTLQLERDLHDLGLLSLPRGTGA
ncbi:MAG: HAD family hydrolase [Endomicrobiales bacterium]